MEKKKHMRVTKTKKTTKEFPPACRVALHPFPWPAPMTLTRPFFFMILLFPHVSRFFIFSLPLSIVPTAHRHAVSEEEEAVVRSRIHGSYDNHDNEGIRQTGQERQDSRGGSGGGGGGGGVLRESWAVATIAFLSLGWAGTLLGLLRVYALLRRERGLEDMIGMGVVMSTQPGPGARGRRHVILQEDVDDVEL